LIKKKKHFRGVGKTTPSNFRQIKLKAYLSWGFFYRYCHCQALQSVSKQQLKSKAILSFSTKMKNQIKELLNLKSLQINQARFIEITLKSQKKKKKN
jgi:hypothetical protein